MVSRSSIFSGVPGGLRSSSISRPPPQNAAQKHAQIMAYVELLGKQNPLSLVNDIGELVRSHYPSPENSLLDDVLASTILHFPQHGHSVLRAILDPVIDGTIVYEKSSTLFGSFISLFKPSSERDFSVQWALACGEVLRILTFYNWPANKINNGLPSSAGPSEGEGAIEGCQEGIAAEDGQNSRPTQLLTAWITDMLLATSPPVRRDYFQWCGGVLRKYGTGEDVKPLTSPGGTMPPGFTWTASQGVTSILNVCEDEAARYHTAILTASAVPALLIRSPSLAFQEEHSVARDIPPLAPYARLFRRYYANATPGASCRLLMGLLECPPRKTPHGLRAAVELVNILHAADDCSPPVQLPYDWFSVHFIGPIGAAMAARSGILADAAAVLLYYIFAEPRLFLPPCTPDSGMLNTKSLIESSTSSSGIGKAKGAGSVTSQSSEDATARGLAALMVGHGFDVGRRTCALWRAALGLRSTADEPYLPELILSSSLQPPALSWTTLWPVLRILDYIPAESEWQDCVREIFIATVNAILQRNWPADEEDTMERPDCEGRRPRRAAEGAAIREGTGTAGYREIVHWLFEKSPLSPNVGALLLADALTIGLSYDAKQETAHKESSQSGNEGNPRSAEGESRLDNPKGGDSRSRLECSTQRGAVATFDSYIVSAICALAGEVQLVRFSPSLGPAVRVEGGPQDGGNSSRISLLGIAGAAVYGRKLFLLELLLTTPDQCAASSEISGEYWIASHVSCLLGRSKACLHALTQLKNCKWDPGIRARAAAVIANVEFDDWAVVSRATGNGLHSSDASLGNPMQADTEGKSKIEVRTSAPTVKSLDRHSGKGDDVRRQSSTGGRWMRTVTGKRRKMPLEGIVTGKEQVGARLPWDAVDVADFLCKNKGNGHGTALFAILQPLIVAEQYVGIGSAAFLCRKLVAAPEISSNAEGNAAFVDSGWHQIVEALCSLVAAMPQQLAPFIVSQAERHLRPWTGTARVHSHRPFWQVNTRIINLLTALLRLQSLPQVLMAVLKNELLLRRATDGLTVDGEAWTLPQLELLEAAAMAVQHALKWNKPHDDIADKLLSLLRDRLPATVRCLSHTSAYVRAMSLARLRDTLRLEAVTSANSEGESANGGSPDGGSSGGSWRAAVTGCLAWEMHYRRASGMSIAALTDAASALECSIPS